MRKTVVVAISLLFVVASAFAQQNSRSNSLSVFVSDPTLEWTKTNGTSASAGYGLAFDHMFTNRVSVELSLTRQRVGQSVTVIGTNGSATTTALTDTAYPFDAVASYHFLTDSRWRPYVGAGLRYVSESFRVQTGLTAYRQTTYQADPEVAAGVIFQIRPSLGLRLDAKQIVGNRRSDTADRAFKGSIGLTFRF
jgi:outer membrane protein W